MAFWLWERVILTIILKKVKCQGGLPGGHVKASIFGMHDTYNYDYKHKLTFIATSMAFFFVENMFGKTFRRKLQKLNNVIKNCSCSWSIMRVVL